ncbi:putative iron-sulfur cluster-binding metallochaperone [Thiomicrorhabdus sediminis]|uniref:putative iron-sulfur cluster-binding metallochaperone n=1 Tax=Thiomicrorhabdus sediminis TaxID=2580412 RepID=UPI0026A7E403
MGCCCGTNNSSCATQPDRLQCPLNQKLCKRVSILTVLHNVIKPWKLSFEGNAYYFCDDPDCDVVYFDNKGSEIRRSDVRSIVGVKTDSSSALICYCFGVSKQDYLNDSTIKDFVIEQTKLKNCSCEVRNPSGKCCLKDFPK